MILKSVRLGNIRSYESAEINFPAGSVLLAGDIGSGKSTILLAVEFAIFGAKKGELPAYTLLRHGKKDGFVELRAEIDGKDAIIKRSLKRSNDDIKQEAGYIIINGIKKEGTSEELRAFALELLGYPKELIKKGKDMIYRYTVYTPQEEMKRILYESEENRIETLRKVFNIDKYKRVRDNSRIITTSLREKKRHFEGFILDLEFKKKELEESKKEAIDIDGKIIGIAPRLDEIKNIISGKKMSMENVEAEIKEMNSLKKELSAAEAGLESRIEQNNRLNDELKRLEQQIAQLKADVEGRSLDELESVTEKISLKEREISEAESSFNKNLKKIKELEVKIEHCGETMEKVHALDVCPVCEQKVDEGHKHSISSREGKKRDELLEQVKNFMEEESRLAQIRIGLKKELDLLVNAQNHFSILRIKLDNLKDRSGAKDEKSNLKERLKKEIGILNSRKIELIPKIEKYSETEQRYKIVKREIDELLPQERFLELEKRKYETEKEAAKRRIASLEREIMEKQKAKEKLAYVSQLGAWIDEFFVNLMSSMERHVMASINSQFNELFRKWFDVIMEDEGISVRVDEDFTPVIEQNGYETYIESLSGGEKTSVALSYRLALNKVINDIVATIKTKDIIMLDEPTDGFSSEQLDKVREVLRQLNMKQAIIVSHEGKIESFVENVIRVEKQDGVSVVV